MDVSAQTTMKDAANCDKRCEWQNSANQKNAERILRPRDIPKGISRSGRSNPHAPCAFLCASDENSVDASNKISRYTCEPLASFTEFAVAEIARFDDH